MIEYVPFDEPHLDQMIQLATREGWPTLGKDRDRALRMMRAPAVVVFVARDDGRVVGYGRALSDGVFAWLENIVVDGEYRGRGIGRRLIEEIFAQTSAERMDLLAVPEAEDFYGALPHRRMAGFRIYPSDAGA